MTIAKTKCDKYVTAVNRLVAFLFIKEEEFCVKSFLLGGVNLVLLFGVRGTLFSPLFDNEWIMSVGSNIGQLVIHSR
jgi:hypothetical protein